MTLTSSENPFAFRSITIIWWLSYTQSMFEIFSIDVCVWVSMLDRILQIGDLDLDFANVILETVNSANKVRIDVRNPGDVSHLWWSCQSANLTFVYVYKYIYKRVCEIESWNVNVHKAGCVCIACLIGSGFDFSKRNDTEILNANYRMQCKKDNTNSHFELEFYVLRLENHPIQIGHSFQIPNENAPFAPHFIFIKCFFLHLLSLYRPCNLYFFYVWYVYKFQFLLHQLAFSLLFSLLCHLLSLLGICFLHSLPCAAVFYTIHFTCNDFRFTC